MKSFREFLKEDITDDQYDEVVKMIIRDCKPFLEQSYGTDYLMYRGVQGLHKEGIRNELGGVMYGKKTVRFDRAPLSSLKPDHEAINAWFRENFNVSARSAAMFVFGEKAGNRILSSYGTPCIVFPIGEFQYIWSPNVRDLYITLNIPSHVRDEANPNALKDFIFKELDEVGYTNEDINRALKSTSEIMVVCKSYYAFPTKSSDTKYKFEKAFE